MKKLFLLFTVSLFGVAAMAGKWSNSSLDEAQTIKIGYNPYGNGDNGSGEKSFGWQDGNQSIIEDAVDVFYEDKYGAGSEERDGWAFAIGQQFFFEIEGTANATGTLKTGIVDEQQDAGYFCKNTDFASPEVKVVAGEPFTAKFTYTVKTLASMGFIKDDDGVRYQTTADVPGLVLGFEMADYAAATEFNGQAPSEDVTGVKKVEIECTKFKFQYLGSLQDAGYTKPYALAAQGVADNPEDGFKYQSEFDVTYEGVATTSDYFNFNIKGKASEDITTLMIALWDASPDADPKPYATVLTAKDATAMAVVVPDSVGIKKGVDFDLKYSMPIKRDIVHKDKEGNVVDTKVTYKVAILAQTKEEYPQLVLDLDGADSFKIGAKEEGYEVLNVAVKEIAAADAIVNGVIYSEGAIVIFNQAGQKVAAASQEFAIASLGAGVYFAKTAEGSFSFVVK